MRITVAAVGRLKRGPERDLLDRYMDRAIGSGRSLGLTFTLSEVAEAADRNESTRKTKEARDLKTAIGSGAAVIALDETGKAIDSQAFADLIGRYRDEGRRDLAIVIGGPDGLSGEFTKAADTVLSFGRMTWPHQMVRVMLAEQLYRVTTILSGHPYHR